MGPVNYIQQVQNPFTSVASGMAQGLELGGTMQAQQKQQLLLDQQQQMHDDLGALADNPNPKAEDFIRMSLKYPQLAEHFKNSFSMMTDAQRENRIGQATQIYAAMNAGRPEIARKLIDDQAAALRNIGNEDDAKAMDTLSQLIEMSPETARTSTGLMLAYALGPDKFATTFSTLGEQARQEQRQPLELTKSRADIRNIDSQIGERAARLRLDADKMKTDVQTKLYELDAKSGELNDGAKKLINDSTISSVASEQQASQMLSLANRLEAEGGGYGAFSTMGEWAKSVYGGQDAMTRLRQEYARIRNNLAVQSLPPGPATDRDIELAMKGFPSDTADAATAASFLRGMAKLNQVSAVVDDAKAEWVSAVGHLGKPKKDIVVGGVQVPAGSTFTDFSRRYVQEKASQLGAQQDKQQVPTRSYMRWAQPGAQ